MTRFFSGFLLFLAGLVFFNVMNGASIAMFINFNGMLLAFFFISAGFLASDWTMADIAAVFQNKTGDEKQVLRSIEMLTFFEKISVASSVIGIIICAVIILSLIGDMSRIGKPLSVALLMPLYCMVFYMFVSIQKSRIRHTAINRQFILK